MKYFIVRAMFLISCLGIIGSIQMAEKLFAEEINDDVSTDLELKLLLGKKVHTLGETVFIKMYIKNNGEKNVIICAWPSEEEMLFTYHTEKKPLVKKDTSIYEKPTIVRESFLTLQPSVETYYGVIEFDEKYFNKIGEWDLSILSIFKFTGEDLGVNGWEGILKSNTVSLTIKK